MKESGRLKNLNDIKAGTKIEFVGKTPGIVDELMGVPTMDGDNVVSARFCIDHEDGSISFHTYRHDGRSYHDAANDIVNVFNDKSMEDFTVTADGSMTYHGDKPVNANMIFNPGDSLVRAVEDKAEWDDEGLPLVGTVCECAVQHQDFLQFEIRGYFGEKVWMASAETGDIAEMVKCCEFRPIKSDKEETIKEMLALDPDDGLPKMLSRSEFCGILYDAKYRIQESGDE